MLSAFARALETIFGSALAAAAEALTVIATLVLVTSIVLAGRMMAMAIAGWRYGWIPGTIVRCPRCGNIAADPRIPRCPQGHEVRFPTATLRRVAVPESRARRLARRGWPFFVAAFLCLAALAGYRWLNLDGLVRPISTITASLSYMFFGAALCAGAFALSPGRSGVLGRVLHAALALALLAPALVLALLARGFEPPAEREIGYLWTTPTALYVGRGGRARREGPPADRLDALTVAAELPGVGVLWEGLEGFHVMGRDVPWRGAGGTAARLVARWLRPSDARPRLFHRSVRTLTLQPNRRVRILATREHIRFVAES